MSEPHPPAAIVTGAGSGVGRATAALLAEAGYSVLLVGRTISKLDEAAEQIAAVYPQAPAARPLAADVSTDEAGKAIVDAALAHFGRIDALCNIAGHAPLGPIDKINAVEWRKTIDTNLTSVVLLTAACWPTFRRQKAGLIVNVSSMASVDPYPGFAMYAPAKVAVNLFTRITANEGKKLGIRAVAIAPGAIETPMLRSIFSTKQLPIDKTLKPEEVGSVIRGCLTGTRGFESGETILLPSP